MTNRTLQFCLRLVNLQARQSESALCVDEKHQDTDTRQFWQAEKQRCETALAEIRQALGMEDA